MPLAMAGSTDRKWRASLRGIFGNADWIVTAAHCFDLGIYYTVLNP